MYYSPVEMGSSFSSDCSFLRAAALGSVLGNSNIIAENTKQLMPIGVQPGK